ncbi:23S rRNA (guanosine(2251)-2'-O)-methyltransferase RlmB [Wenyingzhuangia marina]|uniref:23S rRNA (Guanosine2251-2'-O)-methyltransferase n=1 Tax=Wenyingzhuangia marina TaxID=1195760 RepID=A0A1M5WHT7_9FLAO|nr:23S rRNA (guanosine(2251)-2'-O)-methyltransferase RlmB [Wenyingzhuangia marina]GGF80778.1 23S rRNA (guanosine(2251)-2'-O)-methyltransferase RlmB [Wenyingzhuangia marina]SHH87099.1 23S rRNA (guanosine2251-2'-O)-methyltransferase [Wenyingzhuangia marina]
MEKQSSKIFGIRAIIEAINAGNSIDKVFLQKDVNGALMTELKQLIKNNNITSSIVPVEKLDRMSRDNNHQGAAALIAPISFYDLDSLITSTIEKGETPLFILLDQLSDVRNFGAIIRTAECTGAHGVIIPKTGNAPINGETVKTSAGAAFNVPICKVDHIKDAIFMLQAADIQIVCATEKTEETVYDADFTKPTAIVMGSEDRGINPSILKIADVKVKLPLLGKIGSLNVSVACGAFLYEAVRQRMNN